MLKEYFSEEKYEELKESDNLIYKALEIATALFKHDKDKGGYPYLIHLLYVYRHVDTLDQKVVALLHDTIEDKNISPKDLLDMGFPKHIVEDIAILSRNLVGSDYSGYIDNIVANGSYNALCVKVADLRNNMDMSRIKDPTIKDYERVEKRYIPSYEKISNRLKEMENEYDRHKVN